MIRRDEILAEMTSRLRKGMDRAFIWLLLVQWVFAIVIALLVSPFTWTPHGIELHFHVKLAVVFGGLINILPITLILTRPGWWGTRHTIAIVQMMWSALLITVTGGRIETHFHVFGSLGVLALYRDWRILPTATVIVAADHLIRGIFWPDSVYGIDNPAWWVFLEHAGWVVFMDTVLIIAIVRSTREMRRAAAREARLERTKALVEQTVQERTLELQESSERYRSLVENTEAVTFEFDILAREMLYIAPQASRLLDCAMEDLESQDFLEASIHPDDLPRILREFAQMVSGQRSWADPLDCRLVGKQRRVVHVRTFLTARAGSRRIRAITLDMTRQRLLEAELQQSQKLESVGRLAAGVAHEINTPIQFVGDSVSFMAGAITDVMDVIAKQRSVVNAVLAAAPTDAPAQAAKRAAEDADLEYIFHQVPQAAERALDGVDRVSTIVRSMKVFAHPDATEMAPVDLNAAIESTLTIARNEYRYVASLETDLGHLPPVTCFIGEVNQVVLNVVINAAHAINDIHVQTGTRGIIAVRTARFADYVEIAIRDTGGGIPHKIRDRVFDPFFTTKDVGKGTGQGLSLARTIIVERHKGTLTFETTDGVGTTFYIRLPIEAEVNEREAA